MKDKIAMTIMMVIGGMVGVWSTALAGSDPVGIVKELNTLVDFYTHIKGIEYLVCVAFFVVFVVFYKYIDKSSKALTK